jgi:mannose-1-phosphate guanylyltransferase
MQEAFAVIMAGGSGTRFWPLSRSAWPKQFLPLGGSSESLLQATVRRISGLVKPENIYVVTSEVHADATAEQLKALPRDNILAEPIGRNTAPCVGWAALRIHERRPDAVMAVLPSDPQIEDEPGYLETVRRAMHAAEKGSLVTIGIRPTRPETGYGYVEVGESRQEGVLQVRRFVEKPDLAKAQGFVAAGNYLWNSGMFFFRADVILQAIARLLPDLSAALERCRQAARQGREAEQIRREYPALKPISIDYGVMERAEDILVAPGSFGWHDIGSWTTAWELADKDGRENCAIGESVLIDADRCYVRGRPGKVIALVGVSDLVVVDTPDALLVMPRERAQQVKQVVEQLKERGAQKFI